METLGKQKADPDIFDGGSQAIHRHLYVDAESFHDIGAAALAAGGTVSMFRDTNTGCRRNECRRRRDVESAGSIPARSRSIKHRQGFAIPEWFRLLAHDTGETDQLGSRFTFHPQGQQES